MYTKLPLQESQPPCTAGVCAVPICQMQKLRLRGWVTCPVQQCTVQPRSESRPAHRRAHALPIPYVKTKQNEAKEYMTTQHLENTRKQTQTLHSPLAPESMSLTAWGLPLVLVEPTGTGMHLAKVTQSPPAPSDRHTSQLEMNSWWTSGGAPPSPHPQAQVPPGQVLPGTPQVCLVWFGMSPTPSLVRDDHYCIWSVPRLAVPCCHVDFVHSDTFCFGSLSLLS